MSWHCRITCKRDNYYWFSHYCVWADYKTEVKRHYDKVKKITSDIIDRTDYRFNLDTIVKAYFHNAGRYIHDPVEKERFENPLQSLHPGHGPMSLFWPLFQPVAGGSFSLPSALAPLARSDLSSVFNVWGKYTVATG